MRPQPYAPTLASTSAPRVYRPQTAAVQPKPADASSPQRSQSTPPVYRPQTALVQSKPAASAFRPQAAQKAPPVYRPQGALTTPVQSKPAAEAFRPQATAPPVYRPHTPALQSKPAPSTPFVFARQPAATIQRRGVQPSAIQRKGGTIQRRAGVVSPANTTTLAEGQSALVPAGGTISYTALAAGCMAVTAHLAGGGGAGVHLTLQDYAGENADQQLQQFRALFAGIAVTRVCLVSDMYSNWYFPFTMNADFEAAYDAPSSPVGEIPPGDPRRATHAPSSAAARGWAEVNFPGAALEITVSQTAGPYQFAPPVVLPVVLPVVVPVLLPVVLPAPILPQGAAQTNGV